MTSGVIYKFRTFEDLEKIEPKLLKICTKIRPDQFRIDELILGKESELSLYYCPFKAELGVDRLKSAKVIIVGITPGEAQAIRAFEALQSNSHIYNKAAFSGPMRPRLLKALELIQLHKKLRISEASALFDDRASGYLFSTSLIKYPAFFRGNNYSGQQPRILKSILLKKTFELFTLPVLEKIRDDQIVIPLGDRVSEVLENYFPNKKNILHGFPHPSPANPKCTKFLKEIPSKLGKQLIQI